MEHDECQWQWHIVYADTTSIELCKTAHKAVLAETLVSTRFAIWFTRWTWGYELWDKILRWVWDQQKVVLTLELTPEQAQKLNADFFDWLDEDGEAEV